MLGYEEGRCPWLEHVEVLLKSGDLVVATGKIKIFQENNKACEDNFFIFFSGAYRLPHEMQQLDLFENFKSSEKKIPFKRVEFEVYMCYPHVFDWYPWSDVKFFFKLV